MFHIILVFHFELHTINNNNHFIKVVDIDGYVPLILKYIILKNIYIFILIKYC
jgi:hypothetical protein